MINKIVNRNRAWLVGVGAILVFAILALLTLGKSSVWHDEGYTSILIQYPIAELLDRTAHDVHPPLYYLLLKGWAAVFGGTMFSLRLFSLVTMTTALAILARFLWLRLGDRQALPAILGLTLSPFLLRYAQEARMYGLGTLLVVLTTVAFFEQLSGRKRPIWFWVYVLSLAAALYTQYFLGFMVVGFASILYVVQASQIGSWRFSDILRSVWQKERWWFGATLAAGALFLPWLPILAAQTVGVQAGFWIAPVSPMTLVATYTQVMFLRLSGDLNSWQIVLIGLSFISLVLVLRRVRRDIQSSVNLALRLMPILFFATLASLILISLPPLQPLYHSRYLVAFSPFFYAMLGTLIFSRLSGASWAEQCAKLVIVVTLVGGIANVYIYGNNYDWPAPRYFSMNELGSLIADNAKSGDVVLSTSLWTYFDARHYLEIEQPLTGDKQVLLYMPKRGFGKYGNASAIYGRDDIIRYPDQLCGLGTPGANIWVIEERQSVMDQTPSTWQLADEVNRGYARVLKYVAQPGDCVLDPDN